MKQKNYIAGLYYRLSQEDERQGESMSIENQRLILRKYAEEHGFTIYDEYIDDGVSGTTFDRPQVQRLLDDAKTGVINTIIVKDLSRFGRNYIEVGQYVDYVFPSFGIRFIAIQDNVDTENRESNAMEMMPIVNLFNEWHAANTSKKTRAVKRAKAKEGVYIGPKAAYGYLAGKGGKRTFTVNEETAPTVRRIFEMYVSGISPKAIADTLNAEGVITPSRYTYEKLGQRGRANEMGLWTAVSIRWMLDNITYLGHMPQLMTSSVSYKNRKKLRKDPSEWEIAYNTHEPIISQELWDRVHERMKSIAHGKITKTGYTSPLSGFLVCADCGAKLKLCSGKNKNGNGHHYHFDCGYHLRYGKSLCFSHYISEKALSDLVLEDIREMAKRIVLDEETLRKEYLQQQAETADKNIKSAKKELQTKRKRAEKLSRLIRLTYEDRANGKMPEDICFELIEKYSTEQKTLTVEIAECERKITDTETSVQDADNFIRDLKNCYGALELTREMCYTLIDRIVVGGLPKITGKDREIDIVYKVDIASVLRYKFGK